jgi:hypothetical protein
MASGNLERLSHQVINERATRNGPKLVPVVLTDGNRGAGGISAASEDVAGAGLAGADRAGLRGRGAGCGQRLGDRPALPPAPAPGGPAVPQAYRRRRPQSAGAAPDLRLTTPPTRPRRSGDGCCATPVPPALHPDEFQLDQPGRTVVRRAHHPQAPPLRTAASPSGTRTPGRSCGPRPRMRSSNPSPPTASESASQDTRGHDLPGEP